MPVYEFKNNSKAPDLFLDCFLLSEKNDELVKKKPRKTSHYEIYNIISGTGVFKIDEKIIEFKPGSVLFVSPERFRQWIKVDKDIDAYVTVFKDEFISEFFNDHLFLYHFVFFHDENTSFHLPFVKEEGEKKLAHFFKYMKSEIKALKFDSKHLLRACLYYLLVFLNREYKEQYGLKVVEIDNLQASEFRHLLVKQANKLMRAECFAEEMGISVSQLNKITRKAFGKTASTMIKEQRLLEAKRLIKYSTMDISQISHQLNFSNPSNFNRIFKSCTGKTPACYRKGYLKTILAA